MAKSHEEIHKEELKQEKLWIDKMSKMKFPATGAGKKFLVQCDGKAFAGYNSRKEAEAALNSYSANVRGATNPSSNSKMSWNIVEQ